MSATTRTTSMRDPLAWSEHAACVEALYLPWTEDNPDRVEVAAIAAVCSSCPVRLACAAYVTAMGVNAGFWAGRFRDPYKTENAQPVFEPLTLPGLDTTGLDVGAVA